jgi:uncharacterized membrane protein YoaK (UPF0700 family)
MDALAFLMLGHVFTSAMSGNSIILGLAAGQGEGALARSLRLPSSATIVFTSTLADMVATVAERLRARQRPVLTRTTWRQGAMYLAYLGSAAVTGLGAALWPRWLPYIPLAAVALAALGLSLKLLRL